MKELELHIDPAVQKVVEGYPESVREQIYRLRSFVIDTAKETDEVIALEETLKWGEPSYLTKYGSTIRIAWKSKKPRQYAVYFKCTSRLVEVFRTVFEHDFEFEKNRAIVFQLDSEIPVEKLKVCLKAALTYHKVKHLPTLRIS